MMLEFFKKNKENEKEIVPTRHTEHIIVITHLVVVLYDDNSKRAPSVSADDGPLIPRDGPNKENFCVHRGRRRAVSESTICLPT